MNNISKKNLFSLIFLLTVHGTFIKSFASLGIHGSKTITTTNVIVNEFTTLTSNASAGTSSITVASSSLNSNGRFSGSLAAGELVMIIQMQGATLNTLSTLSSTWGDITAYNNAGKFEFDEVAGVPNGTTINLVAPLLNSYTLTGKVQVIRVPRYITLTINTGASLTTPAWNGSTGGVIAIEDSGSTTINGTIDVSGLGFRGGTLKQTSTCCPRGTSYALLFATTNNAQGAAKGEGIGGDTTIYDGLGGRYGRGSPANGGGGGNCHNTGGGGGSNGDNGIAWNGLGNPDTVTSTNWKTAWDLEGGNFHTNVSSGGGKAGYSYANSNSSPLTTPPGNSAWNQDYRSNVGGWGGRPLDNSGNRIFMGGGGGAGDANDGYGSAGANGGGIVYLLSGGTLAGSGAVKANGGDASPSLSFDAAGGGGGGGSVVIYKPGAASVTGVSVNANGGKGGNQQYTGSHQESEGPGGGGGGGFIAISTPHTLTTTVSGGANGTTNANKMTLFIPNGATMGGSGLVSVPTNPYSGDVPLPVSLTSFTGEIKNKTIELDWITESEINNDYFLVQRSPDNNNYDDIDRVNGNGNTTLPHGYSVIDHDPLNGINYYRLCQVDYDGTRTLTLPISIRMNSKAGVFVFPDPATAENISIFFTGDKNVSYTLEITDISGKSIVKKENQILHSGANKLNVSDNVFLSSGIYFVSVINGVDVYHQKIVFY